MTREHLTLPAPARELWLGTRDLIGSALQTLPAGPYGYRIGGGTILAARWKHRRSFDIDLTVGENTPLYRLQRLYGGDFERAIEDAGGRARFDERLDKYKMEFPAGDIDLWAREPILKAGHETGVIDEREETVLSNAQILRGKLERAEENLVRDVYDVISAAGHDPDALAVAVNAIPRDAANIVAACWHRASPALAADAEDQLAGIEKNALGDTRALGARAATQVLEALFDEVGIWTGNRKVIIEVATRGGRARTFEIEPHRLDHDFEAYGLNAHLDKKGPGAEAIRNYAGERCRQDASGTLFRENKGVPTAWRTANDAFNVRLL